MRLVRTILRVGALLLICLASFKLYTYITSPIFDSQMRTYALGTPDIIQLSGTGSMYPTFPKGSGSTYAELVSETVASPSMYRYPSGISLFDKKYYQQSLGHGDIVSFANSLTKQITRSKTGKEAGFVKRIIGLGGDRIELINGIVYRNGEALKEPYIARAQSTFGGEYLRECREIQIPPDSLFVMGDNRKGSNDSRHLLGIIKSTDVDHFIPYAMQKGLYDKNWHDASQDLGQDHRIRLNVSSFMKMLNDKRRTLQIPPLKYNDKLEVSARKRGEVMLRTDDFSFEATKSGYTMEKSMKEAGYSNIIWAELPVQGYYESDELFEHLYDYTTMFTYILNSEYTDFAVASVQGNLNNCPAQVLVLQIAGYRPPNYPEETIANAQKILESLRSTVVGWRDAKGVTMYYEQHQSDLDRLLELYDVRIRNWEDILNTMNANKWLTESQNDFINKDSSFAEEQFAITQKLNDPRNNR